MKLKEYSKEEIEAMSYDEIALHILQESGKKMKIQELFQKVCKLLGLKEDEYIEHITDFFELLSTNKKFVMLKNGYWDLQTRHQSEITIEETEEDVFDPEEEEPEVEEEPEEDNIYYEEDTDDDVEEDDLSDLVVIDEDEEAGS